MVDREGRRFTGILLSVACLALMPLGLAACGDDDDSSSSSSSGAAAGSDAGNDAAAGGGLEAAKKVTEDVYTGARFGEPPTEASPAATGKTVWIVSAGQSSPTAKAVTAGVEAGAKAIGWDYKVCDGKLDPTAMSRCWEQAIAAKPD